MTKPDLPVLYSFRRCPFAIRARIALKAAEQTVELREIILRDKPAHMLEVSPKGTVPVLWFVEGKVIDQSLEIALWALSNNDPQNLMKPETGTFEEMRALIELNDGPFKHHLDRTKYATRYPGENPAIHRKKAGIFLSTLSERLEQQAFLFGKRISLADITIAPFIRQFANIDRELFNRTQSNALKSWLDAFLENALFLSVMTKHKPWQPGDETTYFPVPAGNVISRPQSHQPNNGSAVNQAQSG